MKKVTGIIISVFILFISGVIILATVDFNRLGKDHLYVQVDEPMQIDETTLDSGQIVQTFWYESPAYDDEGETTNVEFSATRELREDAYLMLYVRNENEVTSYDEVDWGDIPSAAQEKLASN
ncbi:YxeA family protein [Amphibacillus cookii]|uniref:YxeA family protein n=1 Tax=Amphibacillus cookii TaxID=767787 RepID=UPI001956BE05|nr:YxeA family protein [Amphibacillus cookii]MBM7542808.1 uncharacterized protein (TIGR01655 family) [Amphibacillus cookii]